MTTQSVTFEDFPAEWKLLGGRGLSAKILTRDCDPSCDPLGPDNVLVMAPGVLSGTAAPTSGRISIGGKSPLTGGIKEANAGGNPSQHLMKLGFRGVIVKGQPADRNKRYGLRISADTVEVVEADEYKGMWNYAVCEKLLANEPKTASVITIGPAGEHMLSGASVACTDQDKERRPARHAARGGLGAVMGSKGLKWVLIDPGKAPLRKAADHKGFTALNKGKTKEYLAGPQMFKTGIGDRGIVETKRRQARQIPQVLKTSIGAHGAQKIERCQVCRVLQMLKSSIGDLGLPEVKRRQACQVLQMLKTSISDIRHGKIKHCQICQVL